MERPAFWKVPRDLSNHQLSEAEVQTTAASKPALASLASYSIGFANLGLKGTPLSSHGATEPTLAPVDKPCLSALASHAYGCTELHAKCTGTKMADHHQRTFTVVINRRHTNNSWGISIAGGCDQGTPLVITKVQSNSAADGVVKRGDLVRKIGDYDSRDIRHQDVQTLFQNAGPSIKLVVSREHRGSAPPSAPGSRASSVPPVLPTHPPRGESPYIMAGLNPALIDHPRQFTESPHRVELEEEMHMVTDQPYRTTPLVLPGAKVKKDAAPTESYLRHHPNPLMRAPPPPHGIPHEVFMKQKVADSVLQRVVGEDPHKKVTQQFNSPIGLYSEDNIVNTIVQQTGATPYKKTVVYDPAKSETYRALKESEYGDTVQEIPTPVEPKVFSPAKVNTKRILPPKPPNTPHRSAAHSVPGPMHNINSVGSPYDSIQQSNSFKRLMHMVLEDNY